MTSDPVENISGSLVCSVGSAGVSGSSLSDLSLMTAGTVTTGLGGFELSSRPSMQTTEKESAKLPFVGSD